jgi:tight adherence protein B
MDQLFLILACVAIFCAVVMFFYGTGDWIAEKFTSERGVYERIVGKELYRLFLNVSPQEFFMYHIFFTIFVAGGFYLWFESLIWAAISLPIGIFAPRFWLQKQWKGRIKEIDSQIEEAMVYMSNSFKANPSLPDAIQDVVNSMGPPVTQELGILLKEYQLGTPLDEAMLNTQTRVPARNLQLAVSALLIGRSVGGNIPKILNDVSKTINESYRLERVIDTQTAQGKMQAWVMGLMPAVCTGLFYLQDPELIIPLFETFNGWILLGVASTMNLLGVAMILKIVRIDV